MGWNEEKTQERIRTRGTIIESAFAALVHGSFQILTMSCPLQLHRRRSATGSVERLILNSQPLRMQLAGTFLALLLPLIGLLTACANKAKQEQTFVNMGHTGNTLMSWLAHCLSSSPPPSCAEYFSRVTV